MKYDEIRTKYDKSLNHIIDLQEKISEALVDDSFKTEDFKSLKDELSEEKNRRDTLFEQLHVTDKTKNNDDDSNDNSDDDSNDNGNDNGDDSETECTPKDVLDAVNKMNKNILNEIDNVYNKLSEAINNIDSNAGKAKTTDEDKAESEEPKKAATSDSVKKLFDELEKTFNE